MKTFYVYTNFVKPDDEGFWGVQEITEIKASCAAEAEELLRVVTLDSIKREREVFIDLIGEEEVFIDITASLHTRAFESETEAEEEMY